MKILKLSEYRNVTAPSFKANNPSPRQTWVVAWRELRKEALAQGRPITLKDFEVFNNTHRFQENLTPGYFRSLQRIIDKPLKDLEWQINPPLCFNSPQVFHRKYIPKEFTEDRQGKDINAVLYVVKDVTNSNSKIKVWDIMSGEPIDTLKRDSNGLWHSEIFRNYGEWLENGSSLMSLSDSNPVRMATRVLREQYSNCDIEIQPSRLPESVFNMEAESDDESVDERLIEVDLVEPIPLNNGVHYGLQYGYNVEFYGKLFKTKTGVKCYREHCGGYCKYVIKNGKLFGAYTVGVPCVSIKAPSGYLPANELAKPTDNLLDKKPLIPPQTPEEVISEELTQTEEKVAQGKNWYRGASNRECYLYSNGA